MQKKGKDFGLSPFLLPAIFHPVSRGSLMDNVPEWRQIHRGKIFRATLARRKIVYNY